jgi:uncharacterized delta-60 repeat protein
VFRFTTGGVLDPTFDGTGIAVVTAAQIDSGAQLPSASGVAVDGSNNVVVAVTGDPDSAIVRFTSAGALDTTFGGGTGYAHVANPSGIAFVQLLGLAIDGAGRIVVTGFAQSTGAGYESMIALRFTATGAPDTTFGTGGVFMLQGSATSNSEGKAVTIDATNHPLIAGIAYNPAAAGYTATVWRLTP